MAAVRRRRLGCVLAVTAPMWLALPAFGATQTNSLSVTMTITASCVIGSATLAFGSSSGTALQSAAVNAQTTVSVTCTSSTPYSIGMSTGANPSGSQRRMISGGNYIDYNLYTDAVRLNSWTTATDATTCATANSCVLGTGTGSAQSIDIYGTVPIAAVAPPPGSYSDTVTMTITY